MTSSLSHMKFTFIGAGSMAEAIIRGLITKGGVHGENIFVINRSNRARLEELRERYGIRSSVNELEKDDAIRTGHIVVLAFKPKDALEGLSKIKHLIRPEQLLVSVIAGLTIDTMQTLLDAADYSIVRTMPNTSSTIGLGVTGMSFSPNVTPAGRQLAVQMFESAGIVSTVEEPLLDTITGVSGSGPAYIYYMMEAMIQGGVQGGLEPEEARRLVVQTVLALPVWYRPPGKILPICAGRSLRLTGRLRPRWRRLIVTDSRKRSRRPCSAPPNAPVSWVRRSAPPSLPKPSKVGVMQ